MEAKIIAKFLFELYHGSIRPAEGYFPKEDDYRKAAEQVCSIETAFMAQLDEIDKELYSQLNLALIARDNVEYAYIYANGSRTGETLCWPACYIKKTFK